MRKPACLAASIAALSLLLAAAPAQAGVRVEPKVSTVISGFASFGSVMTTPHRVFVSEGNTGSAIAVFDLAGNRIGTLDNIPGPSGMAVAHNILYVAAYGASKIFRYDLSTAPPTKLTPFSTAPLPSPMDLVFAGHRLWFTSGCEQWGSRVGWMPTSDGLPVRELEPQSTADWTYCTAIEHGAAAPDRIFLHNTGVSPQNLFQYDVSLGHKPRLVNDTSNWQWGSYNGAPVVPLPGGDEIAMGWTGGISTFQMTDFFGPTFTYTGPGAGLAVATTPERGGLLAASTGGPYSVEVQLWQLGYTDPIHTVNFSSGTYGGMFANDLAFSLDGTRLYAVSGAYYGDGRIYLHVIHTKA